MVNHPSSEQRVALAQVGLEELGQVEAVSENPGLCQLFVSLGMVEC
jgi:hypothetical protein